MLQVLMYHRTSLGHPVDKYANAYAMLRAHLTLLKERYSLVLPGDPLHHSGLSVCLTFDDATYDFYYYIFPLLKELEIRVLLGVPVHYILPHTRLASQERLKVPYTLMMQEGFYDQKAPFCTWEELEEMVDTGLVEVASHSYLHCNLTFPFVDLHREVVHSKAILEQKLAQPVSSFIYPFGKMTLAVHAFVAKHYPYTFRIGGALNFGWGNGSHPLTRICADNLTHPHAPFSWLTLTKAFTKALISS
jgi:peptidoglycan/xylan/chitin deacetylase (PgdA/CDA1 family)